MEDSDDERERRAASSGESDLSEQDEELRTGDGARRRAKRPRRGAADDNATYGVFQSSYAAPLAHGSGAATARRPL